MSGKKRDRDGEEVTSASGAPLSAEFYFRSRKLSRLKSTFEHMESLWCKVHCQLKKHVLP
jgi:hypothetical protein